MINKKIIYPISAHFYHLNSFIHKHIYLRSLILPPGLSPCKLMGPSILPLIALSTRLPGAEEVTPPMPLTPMTLCRLGLLGALPTEFLGPGSGTRRRATSERGNEEVSSSGEDMREGERSTTGTLEKCSVGILICGRIIVKISWKDN